ncbi:MAG TPA: hypothetical protein VII95_16545 [Terriglobales bacterium]
MKTQVVHSTSATLDPFLRLILKLATQHEAETVENLQSPGDEAPNLSAAAASEQQPGAETARHVFTRALTLGPFLTLLLTLHNRGSWTERDWWQNSTAPRRVVLAARYVSR